jgi:glycine/D-amino acid oxidase-like deaminating enzyme
VGNKPKHILIIGSGLAGSTLALELIQRGHFVQVMDNLAPNASSRVAAGIINPIVPKGVKKTWKYQEIFPSVFEYYRNFESILGAEFVFEYPMLQIHANDNERFEWRKRGAVTEMTELLAPTGDNTIVNSCGRLDVLQFLNAAQIELEKKNQFRNEQFLSTDLIFLESGKADYRGISFDEVIFCEGIGIMQNPWFNYLFFDPTGGDILTVQIPNLPQDTIIKQKQWIVPTKEKDIFLLGSTFHKQSISEVQNPADAKFLIERAELITGKKVTLIKHQRAIRPTVQNRRPYLGRHHTFKNLSVYNGLGAKGSALCSWLSPMMADFISNNTPLNEEVDISRIQ